MRTAEEILKSECDKVDETLWYIYDKGEYGIGAIINTINEARKEAIEECAKDAAKFIEECEGSSFGIDEELLLKVNELK